MSHTSCARETSVAASVAAAICSVLQCKSKEDTIHTMEDALKHTMLQCDAVCCIMLQCDGLRCSVL